MFWTVSAAKGYSMTALDSNPNLSAVMLKPACTYSRVAAKESRTGDRGGIGRWSRRFCWVSVSWLLWF